MKIYAINYHTIVILSAESISTKKNTIFSSAILFTIQNSNKISIFGSIIRKLRFKESENQYKCCKFFTLFTYNTFGMLYLSMPNNSSFQLLIIIILIISITDTLNCDTPPPPNVYNLRNRLCNIYHTMLILY